jgi:hypothetical protein
MRNAVYVCADANLNFVLPFHGLLPKSILKRLFGAKTEFPKSFIGYGQTSVLMLKNQQYVFSFTRA